jgi:hypothetical protein
MASVQRFCILGFHLVVVDGQFKNPYRNPSVERDERKYVRLGVWIIGKAALSIPERLEHIGSYVPQSVDSVGLGFKKPYAEDCNITAIAVCRCETRSAHRKYINKD